MNNGRFPRTILEAFGCDADNSDPISGPYTCHGKKSSPFLFFAVVMLVLFAVMVSIHLYAGVL